MAIIAPTLDHVALWLPDLEADAAALGALLDVTVHPGGAHAGQGTRNLLVGGPGKTYLELLSSDPAQRGGGPLARRFDAGETFAPCLAAFASHDLDALAARARAAALTCDGPKAMSRKTMQGTLTWRLLFLTSPRWAVLPFFIDWGEAPHPSLQLSGGLAELTLEFCDPDPAGLKRLLNVLGLEADVREAPHPGLAVRLRGAQGSAHWQSAVEPNGAWRTIAINP
jgi:hypothetical protein